MSLPYPLSAMLESTLNAALRLDPEAPQKLKGLEGRTLRVNLTRPRLSVLLAFANGRLQLVANNHETADTTLTGSLSALRSLAAGQNTAIYRGELTIEGDVGLGQQLKEIIKGFDPDWQDRVSPVLGDALTHRLDRAQADARHWLRRTSDHARQDMADYLEEEAQLLTPAVQIEHFCDEVDDLRDATERLAARIRLLEQQHDEDCGSSTC